MGPISHLRPTFLALQMDQQSIHCSLFQGVKKVLEGLVSSLTGKEVWGASGPGLFINKPQSQTPDEVMVESKRGSVRMEKR